MEAPADEFPLPERPRRSSSRRIVILVVALVAGWLFLTRVLPLLIVLAPASTSAREKMEDMNSLRQIAGLIAMTPRSKVPLSPDGRIDVYALLTREDIARQIIVDVCRSARTGKGPTWKEIEAGDYTNFPYQRYRGVPEPLVRVPVVWDPRAADGGRLAAFSDWSARFEDEAAFRDFFRSNPGQE